MDEAAGVGRGPFTGPVVAGSRLFEMSIDLLAVLDLDTRLLEASRSWERALGWPLTAIVNRPLLELVHPEDTAHIGVELARLATGDDIVATVVRLRTSEGGYLWLQGNARADLSAGRIFLTATDITARVELEQALRRQMQLEELVASIAAGLIGTPPDETLSEIERGVAELARVTGADRGHFLRASRRDAERDYVEWRDPGTVQAAHTPAPDRDVQHWWREVLQTGRVLVLATVEDLGDEAPKVVQSLQDDGVRSLLHVPLRRHGDRWGFLTLVAVRKEISFSDAVSALLQVAGECFMIALAQRDDALALHEARRELEQRNAQLERSNEELERFAYSAAHDLKAPLSRIEMALSAASGALGPEAGMGPTHELLSIARRGSARMRQLIEDLLAFAAVGQVTEGRAPVDLDDVLRQVLSDLEPAIEASAATITSSSLPEVHGHRALLGQLLQNLLTNALKFARPGVPPVVRITAETTTDGVTVTVADNGIGVDPAAREEVFGVFARLNADESSPGSGIGLATCLKVVTHHGGRIWLDEGIDGGTAAHVWLPVPPIA